MSVEQRRCLRGAYVMLTAVIVLIVATVLSIIWGKPTMTISGLTIQTGLALLHTYILFARAKGRLGQRKVERGKGSWDEEMGNRG